MNKDKSGVMAEYFNIDSELIEMAEKAEAQCCDVFKAIEKTAEYNQCKVISAFQNNRVSETHFIPTTGYGYGDRGRDALDSVYAEIFGAEDAIVRQSIASGTVAIVTMMFANLRPGEEIIFATGKPYDTLRDAVGIRSGASGSMSDYGITHKIMPLNKGAIDIEGVVNSITEKTRMVFLQRSRGYDWRPSVMIDDADEVFKAVKAVDGNIITAVDNCYGEFVETLEPGAVGADLVAGSLIKNPGGGLCPSGGYICGRRDLIENCASRIYSPGLSKEVGSSPSGHRLMFQGLFMAPHIVGESLKGAAFASALMQKAGYGVSPLYDEKRGDIIQLIKFKTEAELIAFCEGVQKASPVDSNVKPVPWDMPGYSDKVIMAAGTFVQGASIEFSADAPVTAPYTAYMQGGLVYSQVKLGIMLALQSIENNEIIK